MNIGYISIAFCSLLLLSACATANNKNDSKIKVSTLLAVNQQCMITRQVDLSENDSGGAGFLVSLGAIILPQVINYAFDSYKKRITEVRVEESTGKIYSNLYSGSPYLPIPPDTSKLTEPEKTLVEEAQASNLQGTVSPPAINPQIGCITVITGKFKKDHFKQSPLADLVDDETQAVDKVTTTSIVATLNKYGWGVKEADIYSIYEFSLSRDKTNQTFRVNDHLLLVNKLLNGEKKSGLVYKTIIAGPGKTEDGTIYSTIVKNFGTVTPGTIKQPNSFTHPSSGYYSEIGITPAALKVYTDKAAAKETEKVFVMPVKIESVMTQTVTPSESAKLVGLLLDATKDTVSSTLKEKYFPDDISIKVFDAKIALQKAVIALAEAPDGTEQENLAQLQFDKACKQLNELGELCN